ncbi:MAG: response regulator [Deltaproteobacteria bacterium]|nr:response regulator [Deltaproteobacteria bacterium]
MPESFNVLIVDDEDDFRETLVKRFKKRNLNVFGAESGQTALDLMNAHLFDVVILDVKMPGMNGLDTLREMKKKNPLMEVILLTGHASMESGVEGMHLGAFDYVMKPVNIDDLLEMIRQAYERKLIHEENNRGRGH